MDRTTPLGLGTTTRMRARALPAPRRCHVRTRFGAAPRRPVWELDLPRARVRSKFTISVSEPVAPRRYWDGVHSRGEWSRSMSQAQWRREEEEERRRRSSERNRRAEETARGHRPQTAPGGSARQETRLEGPGKSAAAWAWRGRKFHISYAEQKQNKPPAPRGGPVRARARVPVSVPYPISAPAPSLDSRMQSQPPAAPAAESHDSPHDTDADSLARQTQSTETLQPSTVTARVLRSSSRPIEPEHPSTEAKSESSNPRESKAASQSILPAVNVDDVLTEPAATMENIADTESSPIPLPLSTLKQHANEQKESEDDGTLGPNLGAALERFRARRRNNPTSPKRRPQTAPDSNSRGRNDAISPTLSVPLLALKKPSRSGFEYWPRLNISRKHGAVCEHFSHFSHSKSFHCRRPFRAFNDCQRCDATSENA